MENRKSVYKLVVEELVKIGKEEDIKTLLNPESETKIKGELDSMGIVALSVELEDRYAELFNKEVKILDDSDPNFLDNFNTVDSLVDYINNL